MYINYFLKVYRKVFYFFAIQNDIIVKNPCKVLSVKYERNKKRVLTQQEKDSIVNSTDLSDKEYILLLLLRYTGMRRGEIFSLTKDDVDKSNMTININKTLVDNNGNPFIQNNTKSSAGMRKVPILLPLAKPLFDYINVLDTEYL